MVPAIIVSIAAVVSIILFSDIDLLGWFVVVSPVLVILRRWAGGDINAAMMLTIPGHINILVPAVLDEIDRPAAGTVRIAVSVPISDMGGRYAEIDRWVPSFHASDNHRFSIDQTWWGGIADVDAAIKSGFPHTDGYSGLSLAQHHGKERGENGGCCKKKFHCILSG